MQVLVAIPALDGLELTRDCVEALGKTAVAPLKKVVILDNNSLRPYAAEDFEYDRPLPFAVEVRRRDSFPGFGYYAALKYLREEFSEDVLVLMHNDVLMYDRGWDRRLAEAFEADSKLMLVGLCGSNEFDTSGGRGAGTMCFFRGERGQPQSAGERITDLRPAVVLDSLFMAFRREAVDLVEKDWDAVPISHFYDKMWALRLVLQGYRVGVLGAEIDHMGGMTCVANNRYHEAARAWCEPRGYLPIPEQPVNWDLPMYLEGQRRMFSEFGDGGRCSPVVVERDWTVRKYT